MSLSLTIGNMVMVGGGNCGFVPIPAESGSLAVSPHETSVNRQYHRDFDRTQPSHHIAFVRMD
jgi:hypothetical protein